MLFACKQVALATKNGEPQVYRDVHEDSLIAPSIILPKVENTANDNVKRFTFSRSADASDIESCKRFNQFFEEPTSTLYKLHHQLDKAVCEEVYGWAYEARRNYNEALFELNQQLL